MESSIFDKRVVRRNIERGLITQQDYLDHLAGLPDTTDLSEPVEEQLYPEDELEDEHAEESGEATSAEMA